MLLVTSNSATYELIWVFGYSGNNTRVLENFYTLNVFGHIGGQNYRSLDWIEYYEGYFTTQYHNTETNSIVLAVYYTQPFDLLSQLTRGFRDDLGTEFFNMIGGISIPLASSVGMDVQAQHVLIPGPQKTRLLTFDSSKDNKAVLYELEHQFLTIKVIDRDYEPQSFSLSFVTDNKQKLSKIDGKINVCQPANFDPFCVSSEETIDKLMLYTEVEENLEIDLRSYIIGHNLVYTYETDEKDVFELQNGLNQMGPEHGFPNQGITLSVAQRLKSTGDMSIFRLSYRTNGTQKIYYLAYLYSNGLVDPILIFDRQLTEANPKNTVCSDLTALSDELVLIDCVQTQLVTGTDLDHFIIFNVETNTSQVQNINSEWSQQPKKKYNKKSLPYQEGKEGVAQYLISSPRFRAGSPEAINFLNIYYFDRTDTDLEHQEGKLLWLKMIDADDLGLESLNVVDFEVLDGLIFVMDQTAGLISFQYQYDPVSKTG